MKLIPASHLAITNSNLCSPSTVICGIASPGRTSVVDSFSRSIRESSNCLGSIFNRSAIFFATIVKNSIGVICLPMSITSHLFTNLSNLSSIILSRSFKTSRSSAPNESPAISLAVTRSTMCIKADLRITFSRI